MKNIILITMDSVRTDHCSAFGYERTTTPFLSSLDGLQFKQAYSNGPYTAASLSSMLTSRYPLENGHVVYNDWPILPEYLADTEYSTCIAFNNVQIDRFEYADKFDISFNLSRSNKDVSSKEDFESSNSASGDSILERGKNAVVNQITENKRARALIQDIQFRFGSTLLEPPHPGDEAVTDRVISWLEDAPEPYFLWVHYMDTHHPYEFRKSDFNSISTDDFDANRYSRLLARARHHVQSGDYVSGLSEAERQYVIDAYDASLLHLDQQIKRLFNVVDPTETTTFITSDHGEELWDRGHFGHASRPSKPRSMTLYEEMVRVPLIMTGPDVPANMINDPVSLVDILPTVLSVAGSDVPNNVRGSPLDEFYREAVSPDHEPVIAHATIPGDPGAYLEENSSYMGMIREEKMKMIYSQTSGDELYDLTTDPREQKDLIDQKINIASELRKRLQATIQERSSETTETTTDEQVQHQLRELGYLE